MSEDIDVVRIQMVKETGFKYETNSMTKPEDVIEILKTYIESHCNNDRENFITVSLDINNKVLAIHLNSIGTLHSSDVHPREVFKAAILANAADIILAHNHPSGNPEPSREDIEITRRLVDCGKLLGIEVLDHIILGDTNHTSLKEKGYI